MDLSVVEAPEEGLARMLSLGSVVSTTSSSAERETMALDLPVPFRETGTGSIKRVFEHSGTFFVYKVPIIDDRTQKLWDDYVMYTRTQKAFSSVSKVPDTVEIPRVFWFANADTDEFWDEHLEQFP
ncbi:hypothetical protein PGQ11_009089 [Apiospora arundinis]|uniref:Uncharacterized protein n=1 Tax=Apiospora arundinis TaxID=335852 RepID=A0ABR2IHT4_9PEZI